MPEIRDDHHEHLSHLWPRKKSMKHFYPALILLFGVASLHAQPDSTPCQIASIYYQMDYVADLELVEPDTSMFSTRPPRNSWTYVFSGGRITRIVFDPDLGNTREANLYYDQDRLIEIRFKGGFTTRKTFTYNEAGHLTQSIEQYISGTSERVFETHGDTLFMTSVHPESGETETQEIILNDHYKNRTFPFHHQPYFDELFSIHPGYEESLLTNETIRNACGHPVYMLTRFATDDGSKGLIQQVKRFTIRYD